MPATDTLPHDTQTSPIDIRPATPADLEAVNGLFISTMGESFVLSPVLWETVCQASTHRALAAVEGDTVVGIAVVVVSDRIRLAAGTSRKRFHVDELIVAPDHRRMGIGLTLLEHVKTLAQAEAPSYVLINCDFMNVAARRTYEAAGLDLVRQSGDRFEIAFP